MSDFFRNSIFRCFGRKISSFEVENEFREEKMALHGKLWDCRIEVIEKESM